MSIYTKPLPLQNRIWELDFFRGIALLLMIYFHIIYNLKEFYNSPVSYSWGLNYYIGKVSVVLFMLISGISCRFSRNVIRNGVKILGVALIISFVTHLADYLAVSVAHFSSSYMGIKFGVLHFFGISMLLFPVLEKISPYLLVALSAGIIALGQVFSRLSTSLDFLFPIGIINSRFYSSDYYPLVPWLGVFIIGIALGKLIYREKRSIFRFSIKDNIISTLGRNTLLVYVVHQPLILLILAAINFFVFKI
ncbi:MAG: heparan-alpha-glucosaminide N-acetyltransferase [Clostridiales bacterium]|jgi:uncharacterized membrane protein|nr:DUF1624 domain-containing protein [Eubacteriales bacterium]MDH7565594.1 heparan-alpha-glucosaminide N-acetyltransferase [Clostridiales bacterium]